MLTVRRAVAVAVLVVPTSWLIACAAGDSGPESGNSDLNGTSSGSAGAQKKTDAGAEAAAPKPSAAACGAKPDSDSCFTCCVPNNSDPFSVSTRAVDACVQKAAQKCGSECVASVSTSDAGTGDDSVPDPGGYYDPNAPDPCAACESDFDICDDLASKACDADPNCAGAQKCLTDAKCDAKESADDGGLPSTAAPIPSSSGS